MSYDGRVKNITSKTWDCESIVLYARFESLARRPVFASLTVRTQTFVSPDKFVPDGN